MKLYYIIIVPVDLFIYFHVFDITEFQNFIYSFFKIVYTFEKRVGPFHDFYLSSEFFSIYSSIKSVAISENASVIELANSNVFAISIPFIIHLFFVVLSMM